jgi:hypothetical protein
MLAVSNAAPTLRNKRLTERDYGMPGRRVFDLIEIPDEFWQRADVLEALRRRDIGRLFVLFKRHGHQPDSPGYRV